LIGKAAALAALAMGAAAASAAPAVQQQVDIGFSDYAPPHIDVIRGDTVEWTNQSTRKHSVTQDGSGFDSGVLYTDDHYDQVFSSPGQFTYHCTQHTFMRGEVDVYDVLLDNQPLPASPGKPFPLHGRAAADAGTSVSIQSDEGGAFHEVATSVVGSDGGFTAQLRPSTTASYRALVGEAASPPIQLVVLDRKLSASVRRAAGVSVLTVHVTPASPGASIVIQLHLRERFGWWPVRQVKLRSESGATFRLRLGRPVSARAVLTLPNGVTPLATSPTVRVGPVAVRRSR
jgi:plastocyanin